MIIMTTWTVIRPPARPTFPTRHVPRFPTLRPVSQALPPIASGRAGVNAKRLRRRADGASIDTLPPSGSRCLYGPATAGRMAEIPPTFCQRRAYRRRPNPTPTQPQPLARQTAENPYTFMPPLYHPLLCRERPGVYRPCTVRVPSVHPPTGRHRHSAYLALRRPFLARTFAPTRPRFIPE